MKMKQGVTWGLVNMHVCGQERAWTFEGILMVASNVHSRAQGKQELKKY